MEPTPRQLADAIRDDRYSQNRDFMGHPRDHFVESGRVARVVKRIMTKIPERTCYDRFYSNYNEERGWYWAPTAYGFNRSY